MSEGAANQSIAALTVSEDYLFEAKGHSRTTVKSATTTHLSFVKKGKKMDKQKVLDAAKVARDEAAGAPPEFFGTVFNSVFYALLSDEEKSRPTTATAAETPVST